MGKITLEFTEKQLSSMLSIMDTIEGMYGSADNDMIDTGSELNWDEEMKLEIKNIDRMLKSNGYKRS